MRSGPSASTKRWTSSSSAASSLDATAPIVADGTETRTDGRDDLPAHVVTTLSHMVSKVGVRELRRDLSGYLRRVERGESFAVTSRGRAIAVLGPSPEQRDPLARLVLEREAVPARLDLLEVEPLELSGGPPLSEILEDVRADRL